MIKKKYPIILHISHRFFGGKIPIGLGVRGFPFGEFECENVWLKPDPGIPTVVRVPLLLKLVVKPFPPMLRDDCLLPTFTLMPGAILNDFRNRICFASPKLIRDLLPVRVTQLLRGHIGFCISFQPLRNLIISN
jgi:hypothetical protein